MKIPLSSLLPPQLYISGLDIGHIKELEIGERNLPPRPPNKDLGGSSVSWGVPAAVPRHFVVIL